jgi:hypothetical protein
MTEKEKYAEIYGRPRPVSAEDRAAFGRIWRSVWGDDLPYEVAPTSFIARPHEGVRRRSTTTSRPSTASRT